MVPRREENTGEGVDEPLFRSAVFPCPSSLERSEALPGCYAVLNEPVRLLLSVTVLMEPERALDSGLLSAGIICA